MTEELIESKNYTATELKERENKFFKIEGEKLNTIFSGLLSPVFERINYNAAQFIESQHILKRIYEYHLAYMYLDDETKIPPYRLLDSEWETLKSNRAIFMPNQEPPETPDGLMIYGITFELVKRA